MLIAFPEELSYNDRLKLLLAHHNLPLDFKVDEEDIPVVTLALNQDDIESVKIDDEGAIDIAYYGNDWQTPETNKEQYEQTTIRLN
jgi:hypothetical protein